MVQISLNFSDGTRIFYEETNGGLQRFIKYSYTPKELEQIRKRPEIRKAIDLKVKKHNAGKYYYLNVLHGIKCNLDDEQKNVLFNELKDLHDRTGYQYDKNIINDDFVRTFGKYGPNNRIQCAAFFTTIYLAMLDLEEKRRNNLNYLGKTMVLRSCEEVLLKDTLPQDAAVMFERKNSNNFVCNDYYDNYYDFNSSYEKYNGYNGYDDDTIDTAFDGHPEATWNVD